jgi:hypothetical protein
MSRRFPVVLSIVLLIAFAAAAQQRATRESDGAIVLLHPDGRWTLAPVDGGTAVGDVRVFFGNLHSHRATATAAALLRRRTRTRATSPGYTSSP